MTDMNDLIERIEHYKSLRRDTSSAMARSLIAEAAHLQHDSDSGRAEYALGHLIVETVLAGELVPREHTEKA